MQGEKGRETHESGLRGWGKGERKVPGRLFGDLGKNLVLTEQEHFLVLDLDIATTIGREKDGVTLGQGDRDALSILIQGAGTNGQDGSLVQGLLGLFGDKNAGGGLLGGLDTLDENAVKERDDGLGKAASGHHLAGRGMAGEGRERKRGGAQEGEKKEESGRERS